MTSALASDDLTEVWRKKTLPALKVEAAEVTPHNAEALAAWCDGGLIEEIDPFDSEKRQPGINVRGDLGTERASIGDYIFKIASGDFRVKKAGAFRSIWEPNQ